MWAWMDSLSIEALARLNHWSQIATILSLYTGICKGARIHAARRRRRRSAVAF